MFVHPEIAKNHPELAASYRDAYSSITAARESRIAAIAARHTSAIISTAAKVTTAAVDDGGRLTGLAETEKLASMTRPGLVKSILQYCIWTPVVAIWQWVLQPVLVYIVLPCFVLSLISLILNGTWVNRWFASLGEEARERYDDFALNNGFVLDLEHSYASFKRAMYGMWLQMRYNETTDKFVRLLRELYFLPDTIHAWVVRHWLGVLLTISVVFWAWYWAMSPGTEHNVRELSPAWVDKIPAWVLNYHETRKEDGSNSHYNRPEEAVRYEEWVNMGQNESVLAETSTVTETWTETESICPWTEVTLPTETTTVFLTPEPLEPDTTTVTITKLDGATETESTSPWQEVTLPAETTTVFLTPEPLEPNTTTVTITRLDGTTETVAITLTETTSIYPWKEITLPTETQTETTSIYPWKEITLPTETTTVFLTPEPLEPDTSTVTITRIDGTTETVAITLTETTRIYPWKEVTLPTETQTETTSIYPWKEITLPTETQTKTITATETHLTGRPHTDSEYPARRPEDEFEDYWAPPKGKTEVGDGMIWCRECKQWHCCELPY